MRVGRGLAVAVPEANRGRPARRIVNLTAFARDADLRLLEVEIVDLTTDGCRIAGPIDLDEATSIWLKVPGIAPRAARVAWARPGEAGCAFDGPIPPELIEEAERVARGPARELRRVFGPSWGRVAR